ATPKMKWRRVRSIGVLIGFAGVSQRMNFMRTPAKIGTARQSLAVPPSFHHRERGDPPVQGLGEETPGGPDNTAGGGESGIAIACYFASPYVWPWETAVFSGRPGAHAGVMLISRFTRRFTSVTS